MIKRSVVLFIGICSVFMSFGLSQPGLEKYLFMPFLWGIVWIGVVLKRWTFVSSLMIVIVYLIAVFGLMNQANLIWIALGCISGTIAWDLDRFQSYLSIADRISNKTAIIRRHGIHLFVLMGLTLVIVTIGLMVDLKLNLFLVIALTSLLVFVFRVRK
jgi:hypothetical protein